MKAWLGSQSLLPHLLDLIFFSLIPWIKRTSGLGYQALEGKLKAPFGNWSSEYDSVYWLVKPPSTFFTQLWKTNSTVDKYQEEGQEFLFIRLTGTDIWSPLSKKLLATESLCNESLLLPVSTPPGHMEISVPALHSDSFLAYDGQAISRRR